MLACRGRSDLAIGSNGCTVETYVLAGSDRYTGIVFKVNRSKTIRALAKLASARSLLKLNCVAAAGGGLWPGIHQVGDVNAAQAGGKVPAGFCGIRRKESVIRFG
jgi:hypothetical protein